MTDSDRAKSPGNTSHFRQQRQQNPYRFHPIVNVCNNRPVEQRGQADDLLTSYIEFKESSKQAYQLLLIEGIKKETRLQYQANHDQLTGLYNRAGLSVRLEQLRQSTASTPISRLMCDVDDFKTINDTRGHFAGDEVLIEVARRLRNSIRDDDTAARLGG
ncbi:MAG: diguanylate cyclase [Pseudomonadota bacterium]